MRSKRFVIIRFDLCKEDPSCICCCSSNKTTADGRSAEEISSGRWRCLDLRPMLLIQLSPRLDRNHHRWRTSAEHLLGHSQGEFSSREEGIGAEGTTDMVGHIRRSMTVFQHENDSHTPIRLQMRKRTHAVNGDIPHRADGHWAWLHSSMTER